MKFREISIDPCSFSKTSIFAPEKTVGLSVEQPKSFTLKGQDGLLQITCHDIATTAWHIYKNALSFRYRFGIFARYSSDINGSGVQLVEISSDECFSDNCRILSALYWPARDKDWIYEADLKMDGRKDYHPTKNHGKYRFSARSINIKASETDEVLAWINDHYFPWVEFLSRISKPHSTLSEWVDSELDLGIACSCLFCERDIKVIRAEDLKEYLAPGVTLEGLRRRLVCSKCGRRAPIFFAI